MKSKSITIRLSNEEYNILNNINSLYHISHSEYIRKLINNSLPTNMYNQEIPTILGKIYIRLTELGLQDEEITQEVHKLCQMLLS